MAADRESKLKFVLFFFFFFFLVQFFPGFKFCISFDLEDLVKQWIRKHGFGGKNLQRKT